MMLDWMMVEGYRKLNEEAYNNERSGDVRHFNLPNSRDVNSGSAAL